MKSCKSGLHQLRFFSSYSQNILRHKKYLTRSFLQGRGCRGEKLPRMLRQISRPHRYEFYIMRKNILAALERHDSRGTYVILIHTLCICLRMHSRSLSCYQINRFTRTRVRVPPSSNLQLKQTDAKRLQCRRMVGKNRSR